jgi:hypothetical protein
MDGKNHESKTADLRPNSFQLAKYRSSRAIRRKKFQFPAVPGSENAKFLKFLLYNAFLPMGCRRAYKLERKSLGFHQFLFTDINIGLFEVVIEKNSNFQTSFLRKCEITFLLQKHSTCSYRQMDGKNHESKTADLRPNSFQLAKYRSSRAIRRKKFQFPAVPGSENAKFLKFLLYNAFLPMGCRRAYKLERKSLGFHQFLFTDINIGRSFRGSHRKKFEFPNFFFEKMRNYFPPSKT